MSVVWASSLGLSICQPARLARRLAYDTRAGAERLFEILEEKDTLPNWAYMFHHVRMSRACSSSPCHSQERMEAPH